MPTRGKASSSPVAATPHTLRRDRSRALDHFGREGREQVTDIQRARMLTAMSQVAGELGAGNVTVARVVARAGVSRRTFYEVFSDCEECLLAAFEDTFGRVAGQVIKAYEAPGCWDEKIRAALTALLELFDQESDSAKLLVVETLAAGPRAIERRQCALAPVVTAVHEGNLHARGGVATPLSAEATVGAVLSVIHDRLLQPELGSLIELVNPLMSMIVLPYLGPAAARRELQQQVTPKVRRPSRAHENPLKQLDIRLTYRTVRALVAVAEQPRSSNRMIAEASGIADQGQVSKLLTRLERLGLVENAGGGTHRGEPNAWTLTPAGKNVHDAVAA
jgi:AcrR family transcriptional regulator